MGHRHNDDFQSGNRRFPGWRKVLTAAVVLGAAFAAVSLVGTTPCRAASIPAWLDDAITAWNKAHPESPIQFVAIKDSYVWYRTTAAVELGSKDIRGRIYDIAHKNGYAETQDEEMVTTARPAVPSGPSRSTKCWTRSFLRDSQRGSTTTVERLLTTLVCEEGATWSVGFRVLE